MRISQIMSRNVETCLPGDSLAIAAGKMWDHDVGCLPVVAANGQVVGMITDRDISMAAYTQGKPLHEVLVPVAMAKEVYTCRADDSLIEAEETMRSRQIRRLPVLDSNDALVGMVSLNDLAREGAREAGRKGKEISAQEVMSTLAAVCEPHRKGTLTVAA
jgi:CBS domain-containing protein